MAKFRKEGGKETPAISTASLPDIVFMLLFFFMVSTTMREVLVMVDNGMPEAKEVTKLEKKSRIQPPKPDEEVKKLRAEVTALSTEAESAITVRLFSAFETLCAYCAENQIDTPKDFVFIWKHSFFIFCQKDNLKSDEIEKIYEIINERKTF